MAESLSYSEWSTKKDILHPLASLYFDLCHTWRTDVRSTHCAALQDIVVILQSEEEGDILYTCTSSNLASWKIVPLTCYRMSLTTYQSKFVIVGGRHPITGVVTDRVLISDTGIEWKPWLPSMPTKRYFATSVSCRHSEVLVVAGGLSPDNRELNTVEILIEDQWSAVEPLPKPCYRIWSVFHDGNFYFTEGVGWNVTVYWCNSTSLFSSSKLSGGPTESVWKTIMGTADSGTLASYGLRVISIDEDGTVFALSNSSQPWVKVSVAGISIKNYTRVVSFNHVVATALPSGELLFSTNYGVYRGRLIVSAFDPDSKFVSNVFPRLEAVMGIKIVSVLSRILSKLIVKSGVQVQKKDKHGYTLALPSPEESPDLYVLELISQWSAGNGCRPPNWSELLEVLRNIKLEEISIQIKAFMKVDSFEKSMQKSVDRLESKSVVVGGGGVGMSQLVALSLKRMPPSLRTSTPCDVVPPFSLEHQGPVIFKVLTEEMSTMMMKSGKEADPISKVHSSFHIPSFTEVEQHLDIHGGLEYAKSLDRKVFGRIIDTGGQPQLSEILPRFISDTSLGVVVTDLSQDLADYPISYFYGEDGKSVGQGVKSNLTNEQIICLFLQMIVSQSIEQKKVKIMIMGTHRDVEHKSKETRSNKEKKLKNIITTFELEDNVIYTDETHTNVIFAVNALHPEDQDHAIGQKIMEETLNEKNADCVSIAIKHHNLELTLKTLSKSNKLAIRFEEVFNHVSHHYDDYNAMKEGLVILHKSFRILYFLDFPDLVFGEPQLLLNFMSNITVCYIKLTSNPDQAATSNGAWKQFKEQGIVTEQILVEISNVFDKTLTPRHMLEVMEKLLITCKVGNGEYLMPSLLTAVACLPLSRPMLWLRWLPFGFGTYLSDLISVFKSDVTMLLHFPLGLVRYGIYCATVCELITMYKWKLTGTASRNRFCFSHPRFAGTITLIDSFDSFFIVNLGIPSNFSSKSLPNVCSDVRDTLFDVIKKVTEELRYVADQPVVAFTCEHHYQTPHAAEYISSGSYLLCTKDSYIINGVKDKYLLWLDNVHAESNATLKFDPAAPDLYSRHMSLLAPLARQYLDKIVDWNHGNVYKDLHIIAHHMLHWDSLAPQLGLDDVDVADIRHDNQTAEQQRIAALKLWKQRTAIGTYNDLLKVCCAGGDSKTAIVICDLVNKTGESCSNRLW